MQEKRNSGDQHEDITDHEVVAHLVSLSGGRREAPARDVDSAGDRRDQGDGEDRQEPRDDEPGSPGAQPHDERDPAEELDPGDDEREDVEDLRRKDVVVRHGPREREGVLDLVEARRDEDAADHEAEEETDMGVPEERCERLHDPSPSPPSGWSSTSIVGSSPFSTGALSLSQPSNPSMRKTMFLIPASFIVLARRSGAEGADAQP